MRRVLFFIALCGIAHTGFAQIIDKPKDIVKDDAASRVNSNENSVIDNGLGKTESAIKGLFKKKKSAPATAPVPSQQPATQANPPATVSSGATGISAYNNFDFIPGDQIVFYDDFADDQTGEFPAHWNLGRGQAVLNMLAGKKTLLITDGNYAHVSPRIKSVSYLNDPFTIEFDCYGNGAFMPRINFYKTNADATAATNELGVISLSRNDASVTSNAGGVNLMGTFPADDGGDQYDNKWHHYAIAYKKNQLKIYLDQYRVLVVPNIGFAPHAIDIEGIGDPTVPMTISNFRIANGGGMNMLGKKFTDAKIVTHGINFDIDQATIKPESMGTLNMIAGILKDNPEIKFEIDGHTDNSGGGPHNLTLSQARASAVKNQLITMGIDASRLTTKGFGDTKPISDNLTPEGKANNRRVEFIKM